MGTITGEKWWETFCRQTLAGRNLLLAGVFIKTSHEQQANMWYEIWRQVDSFYQRNKHNYYHLTDTSGVVKVSSWIWINLFNHAEQKHESGNGWDTQAMDIYGNLFPLAKCRDWRACFSEWEMSGISYSCLWRNLSNPLLLCLTHCKAQTLVQKQKHCNLIISKWFSMFSERCAWKHTWRICRTWYHSYWLLRT